MPGVVRLLPSLVFSRLRILTCALHALLTETDSLYFIANLRHNYMRLSRVVRCALRLVVPRYTSAL